MRAFHANANAQRKHGGNEKLYEIFNRPKKAKRFKTKHKKPLPQKFAKGIIDPTILFYTLHLKNPLISHRPKGGYANGWPLVRRFRLDW